MVRLARALGGILRNRMPGQLVIQMTNRCNALCPQCGMRASNRFARSTLSIDTIKRILDAAVEQGIDAVSFTGGEPLLQLDDLTEVMRYAGTLGIRYIRTGTNGFVFRGSGKPDFYSRINRLAERLAETPLRNLWISIDSAVPEVHERMRGLDGVIRGIEKAVPILHEHGIYPAANLGINRNVGGDATAGLGEDSVAGGEDSRFGAAFSDAFRQFYRNVIGMGFTIANACYPMSVDTSDADGLDAVYAATSEERVVRFSDEEKAILFSALMRVIPEFRGDIRIFSPLTNLYVLSKRYAGDGVQGYPCRGGIDFFFVEAVNADTYACGYRGGSNFGKFWELDIRMLRTRPWCRQCDWECFRDPSELFGPLSDMVHRPVHIGRRLSREKTYRALWLSDLRYYAACGLFDGRTPPDQRRLGRFRNAGVAPAQAIAAY